MATGEEEKEELENNLTLQREEIEALSAIYGEDFLLEQNYSDEYTYHNDDTISATGDDVSTKSLLMPTFSVSIRPDNDKEQQIEKDGQLEARLIITFQPGYPITSPPVYQLSVPWLRGGQKQFLADALEELYLDHLGESIVYIWVEKLRELLSPGITAHGEEESTCNQNKVIGLSDSSPTYVAATGATSPKELIGHFSNSLSLNSLADDGGNTAGGSTVGEVQFQTKSTHATSTSGDSYMVIHTGIPLTDRKSTFQAHVAPINEICQVRLVLNQLYENKKIAVATHNMYAYRILKQEPNTWLQDCDDDGETHAGSRLLHLLQILNCRNVMVVVSRWYGGIQLHADRFKHINNVARQTLSEFGFIPTVEGKKADDSCKGKKVSSKR
ncbi:unnamed protein product [Orchesella dallaii]|uniref:RWD domain-containing protein n=1 Tax=Orchesella dallaii TaxID=48710 RepID=A0ABP1QTC2_9HEXA